MTKDPAFLFYFRDFLVSTQLMTPAEVGNYTRLLCHLADKGPLSREDMALICGGEVGERILEKFSTKKDGKFYNKRLENEIEKRRNYSKSRSDNRLRKNHMSDICESYEGHMGNGNGNGNIKEKGGVGEEGKLLEAAPMIADYPPRLEGHEEPLAPPPQKPKPVITQAHFDQAWSEYPNKDGKKEAMRHFFASVKTLEDFADLMKAIANYKASEKVAKGFIKNGSTFFNNWRDWVVPPQGGEDPQMDKWRSGKR